MCKRIDLNLIITETQFNLIHKKNKKTKQNKKKKKKKKKCVSNHNINNNNNTKGPLFHCQPYCFCVISSSKLCIGKTNTNKHF